MIWHVMPSCDILTIHGHALIYKYATFFTSSAVFFLSPLKENMQYFFLAIPFSLFYTRLVYCGVGILALNYNQGWAGNDVGWPVGWLECMDIKRISRYPLSRQRTQNNRRDTTGLLAGKDPRRLSWCWMVGIELWSGGFLVPPGVRDRAGG